MYKCDFGRAYKRSEANNSPPWNVFFSPDVLEGVYLHGAILLKKIGFDNEYCGCAPCENSLLSYVC